MKVPLCGGLGLLPVSVQRSSIGVVFGVFVAAGLALCGGVAGWGWVSVAPWCGRGAWVSRVLKGK